MVLVVDFYDSFTYNLVHYFEKANETVEIVFHDELIIEQISNYSLVVLSPGPGHPEEKENMFECINYCVKYKIPIFGVCLGFQALAIYLGAKVVNQQKVKHGVFSTLEWVKDQSKLLENIPNENRVGLYHSWKVEGLENQFVTSYSREQIIMSLEAFDQRVFGVQFHPESILTDNGQLIIENMVRLSKSI